MAKISENPPAAMPLPDQGADGAASARSERSGYSAPALEKGLDILELLAASDEALSLRQIAEALGRSKAEIFRMAHVLIERGYLTRDPSGDALMLSNRLFTLGLRTPRMRDLMEVALPRMRALSAEIGQSSHLVVLNRGETVVVAVAPATSDYSFQLALGYRRAAGGAASGQVILAHQTPEVQARVLPDPVKRAALSAQFDAIRQAGVLVSESQHILGVTDICAPILDGAGLAIAALVVPCLSPRDGRPELEGLCQLILATARAISADLVH